MAIKSAVYNRAKVALQAALGTGATPDVILNGLGFTRPKPIQRSGEMHTDSGTQFPSTSVPSTKEHTEWECSGKLTYNSLIRPFATLFGNVAVTADGTNGKKREFILGNSTSITRVGLTVEVGDSARAKKSIDVFGKGLTISISDAAATFTMPCLGGARQDDVTPTVGATEIVPSIINPGGFDVYVATTGAGLDTAEATGAAARFPLPFMTELSIPDLIQVVYRMNSGDTSFAGIANITSMPVLKFDVGDDDLDFATLLPYIASGATIYIRIVALGAVIAGGTPSQERFAIDVPCKIIQSEEPGENQGASSNSFSLMLVNDPTLAYMLRIQIINTVAAIAGA